MKKQALIIYLEALNNDLFLMWDLFNFIAPITLDNCLNKVKPCLRDYRAEGILNLTFDPSNFGLNVVYKDPLKDDKKCVMPLTFYADMYHKDNFKNEKPL